MKYRIENSRFVADGHAGSARFSDLLRWQFNGARAKWPRRIENKVHPSPAVRVRGSDLAVTWIGHSTVLIQTGGLNILTDPFFSKRASPLPFVGPARVRDPGIAIADLPPIDLILLSHNHYDHLDRPALKQISKLHAPWNMTPLKNGKFLYGPIIQELDWNQTEKFGDLKITLMPARHWSKRGFSDTNEALWGAFVIEAPSGVIYFGADTGYGDGSTFKDVKARFGSPKLSLLPIGAYEPRWFMKNQHMNPQDSVQAHLDLGSELSVAIHHSTVQLTDEAYDAPVKALNEALATANVHPSRFQVMDIGQTLNVL
jgi:L-ascorbate metabolism protein UlaG (beta-lactamase superfamily)